MLCDGGGESFTKSSPSPSEQLMTISSFRLVLGLAVNVTPETVLIYCLAFDVSLPATLASIMCMTMTAMSGSCFASLFFFLYSLDLSVLNRVRWR